MSASRQPVVVGIDFGFTYTKVAVSLPEGGLYSRMDTLNWSSDADVNHTLPTTVGYNFNGQASIGHDVPGAKDQGLELFCHFKLKALDPKSTKTHVISLSGESRRPAKSLLRDFLECLRGRIEDLVCQEYGWQPVEWVARDVDFIFSFPSMVGSEGARILFEGAKNLFGGGTAATHKVLQVTVSEAEAAGVCALETLRHRVKSGHTALVLDVGGGTSDLSIMKIVGHESQWEVDTVFLQPVSSDQLGGAHIDTALHNMIEKHLQEVFSQRGVHSPLDFSHTASQVITHSEYLESKVAHKDHECILRGLEQDIASSPNQSVTGISSGKKSVTVKGTVFTALLDDQIHGTNLNGGIVGQVVAMRDDLFVRSPSRSVPRILETKGHRHHGSDFEPDKLDMVIFSGGVGGSRRVQQKVEEALRAELADDDIDLRKTTAETSFLAPFSDTLQGSQLTVCRGLVTWRVQQLSSGDGDGTGKKKLVFRTWLQSKLGLS